jgi:predicted P-loop ATPase
MHNARLAITALGIECRYDTFHNKLLFGFKGDSTRHAIEYIAGEVTDNGIIALRQLMSESFGFDLTDKHTRDAVISLAIERCFNPVCDMLAEAEAAWDGVKRLDRMAADYFNCEDTPLNAAFIRKTMIAAVARARVPGIKFDQITVLESGEGFNKSTAWRVLAGDENFSDENIIGKNGREVQEQLSEIWIHENADLAGLKKAEIETVKAYASRMIDIARPAYGHFVKKQPRHSIDVGTTNSAEYLQSQTGNRRFWPLKVLKAINIEMLKRDRLQLWGEAAHYQSQGEPVPRGIHVGGRRHRAGGAAHQRSLGGRTSRHAERGAGRPWLQRRLCANRDRAGHLHHPRRAPGRGGHPPRTHPED